MMKFDMFRYTPVATEHFNNTIYTCMDGLTVVVNIVPQMVF